MNNDNRGMISWQGGVMRVDNAFVEAVSESGMRTGYLLISYAVKQQNNRISVETLRLNINPNTLILNSFGLPVCFCDIQKGMWIDAIFSPIMTRSIPPQSNAFLVVARSGRQSSLSVTTEPVVRVDTRNNFLYTGTPNNINRQMRFVITDATVITDRNGNNIRLFALRPGQVVRVTHANFQTASIPPQTTAYHVQVL